ncbi:MAG: porin [Rhodoferax sp.]|nr:porin [Rhodoferax sp.]
MKKTLIALAALAATSAFAQSSVTIFGIVDATFAYGDGATTKTQLTNSGYNSSRLGFRGVEDLGGGLKANFHLEAGVNNDTGLGGGNSTNNQAGGAVAGNGGLNFNRKSVVSLTGGFGEVKLGRDYTPQFWNFTVYDPFGTNGVGTTRALLGSGGGPTNVRASNSIGYVTPSMGGFGAWLQTYMGENTNDLPDAGSGSAVRLSYDAGPLSVAVAFSDTKSNSAKGSAATNVQTTNVAGSFKFGAATVMAFYNVDKNTNQKDVTGMTLGGLLPMGPGTVRLAFSNTDNGANKADQFAVGYVYDLSKRTALYGTFATVSNSGTGTAGLNGVSATAGGTSNGFDIGVRHSF